MARQYNDNGNIVRLEKRATNKFGLFLLILLVLGAVGYGGYYIYKHRSEIDWNIEIPWQKENNEENDNKSNNTNTKKNTNIDLVLPISLDNEITVSDGKLRVYEPKTDDKGYTLKLDYTAEKENSELVIEKILVNNYETSTKVTIKDDFEQGQTKENQIPTTETIRLLKTELDPLNIHGMRSLIFFYRVNTESQEGKLERKEVKVYNNLEFDSGLKGLIELYNNNNTELYYYQTKTDKDNTYIYFDIKNIDYNTTRQVKVKKLLINGKLYEYTDLDFELYRGAENIFYLTIPKEKIKKVDDFTISFFILGKKEGSISAIYITNDYKTEI